jgi:hypothetical protein
MQRFPSDSLRPLPYPCELISKRSVEMWTNFLYGQPIWMLRGKYHVIEGFNALLSVLNFTHHYDHYLADDAALDAIRMILVDHSDVLKDLFDLLRKLWTRLRAFRAVVNMLIEFIVFRDGNEKVKLWAETDNDLTDTEEKFLLRLELRLAFEHKAWQERTGQAPQDLMKRCINHWHSHRDRPGPCYLDVEFAGLAEESTGGA